MSDKAHPIVLDTSDEEDDVTYSSSSSVTPLQAGMVKTSSHGRLVHKKRTRNPDWARATLFATGSGFELRKLGAHYPGGNRPFILRRYYGAPGALRHRFDPTSTAECVMTL
jgi:hypothetical protein